VTSYGPAASYITNNKRAFIIDNENIGIAYFTDPSYQKFLYWHTQSITGTIIAGESPLELVQTLSQTVGTMKPLPSWIQQGCIIGIVGG
jgi:hypothetical protein